jgi:hypothetical protein
VPSLTSCFPSKDLIVVGNQSNHMVAVAQLAQEFNLQFDYYSRPLSSGLRKSPIGNYAVCGLEKPFSPQAALDLGINFHESTESPIHMYVQG